MMKRIFLIILASSLLLMAGCNLFPQSNPSGSAKFYYLQNDLDYNSSNPVVSFETRQAKSSTPEALIELYLQGPAKKDLVSPFPVGLQLVSVTQENDEVRITVSKEMTELSGIELTLACSCLARTLEGIIPAERYRILSSDGRLGGKSSIVITPDTFLWEDQAPLS